MEFFFVQVRWSRYHQSTNVSNNFTLSENLPKRKAFWVNQTPSLISELWKPVTQHRIHIGKIRNRTVDTLYQEASNQTLPVKTELI